MDQNTLKLFEKHYVEFRQSIYWYVYKKTNKKELSEDIVADVFVKLFEHGEILAERDENGVRAWLYTVARNKIIDTYRKKSVSQNSTDLEDEVFEIIASDDIDYLGDLINEERARNLITHLGILSPEEREILELRYKEEMKFAEISEILEKSEGAVKMILYRALDKLKGELGEESE